MTGAPHFVLFGIPVRVEPAFLLVAVYLGIGHRSVGLVAAWVVVMFTGILLHEMGHALAYRYYGSSSAIRLWGLGGLTYGSAGLRPGQRVVVSLAGPFSQLALLGLPAWWLARSGALADPGARDVLGMVVFVNIAWAVLNLLPMMPLDGGNVASDLITLTTKRPGERPARILSIVTAVALGLYALVALEWLFAAVAAALIVALNVQALKRSDPAGFITVVNPPPRRVRRGAPAPGARPAEARAPLTPAPRERLAAGYQALLAGQVAPALAAADELLAGDPLPDHQRAALELRAWAHLLAGRDREAVDALAAVPAGPKPDRLLRACLAVAAAGGRAAGLAPQGPLGVAPVDDLVDALLFGRPGPARDLALRFVGARGLGADVAPRLRAAGPDGERVADVLAGG